MDNYHRYASFEKYCDKFDIDLSLKNVAKFCPLPNRANLINATINDYINATHLFQLCLIFSFQISCALFLTTLK